METAPCNLYPHLYSKRQDCWGQVRRTSICMSCITTLISKTGANDNFYSDIKWSILLLFNKLFGLNTLFNKYNLVLEKVIILIHIQEDFQIYTERFP